MRHKNAWQKEMNMIRSGLTIALLGAATLAVSTLGASARIVCNEAGDCWHSEGDYVYPPGFGLTIHPNDWRWKEGERHAWREHEGRGYWKGDKWVEF
jgi:hypothetical protein